MTDAIINPIVAICLAVAGGLYAMLKMIFTNHTKIKVLEAELNSLSSMLLEVRDDQKELFKEIRNFKK